MAVCMSLLHLALHHSLPPLPPALPSHSTHLSHPHRFLPASAPLTPASIRAPTVRCCVNADEDGSLLDAWERGESASFMRTLIERASRSQAVAAAVKQVSSSFSGWEGLWVARIEHFEKIKFTGLRVRPHYKLTGDGEIVSHVHIVLGPLSGWASASGRMQPVPGKGEVQLYFDDFWISADAPSPRSSPSESDASPFDIGTRALGRALFFEGLAGFPVDYFNFENALVGFRFTPLNSCIVARRAPDGQGLQRVC